MDLSKKIQFPQNITVEEVREAIKDRQDFRECVFDDHSVFVYFLGMRKDIFPDPEKAPDAQTKKMYQLRRECRGLVFNKEGQVISRRFHKFFNVNETEETKVQNLNFSKDFIILEKVDGSMIAPFYTKNQLRFGSKNGITDTALDSEKYVQRALEEKGIDYVRFCSAWIEKGFTPIFEFCSTAFPIVLKYQEDSMNLIALRHMATGNYLPYDEMKKSAQEAKIPVIKTAQDLGIVLPDFSDIQTFDQFYRAIQGTKGVEGFVIRFGNDTMLKIKTSWYFDINHSLDAIKRNAERKKWESILSESYDDLKCYLGNEDREAMDKFAEDLVFEIEKNAQKLAEKVLQDAHLDRKEFSNIVSQAHSAWKKPMWALWKFLQDRPSIPNSAPQTLSNDSNFNPNIESQNSTNNKNNKNQNSNINNQNSNINNQNSNINNQNSNINNQNSNINNQNSNINQISNKSQASSPVDRDLLEFAKKQVVIQIRASLNSKKDFELVQSGLASGISWDTYKPKNVKKIDD